VVRDPEGAAVVRVMTIHKSKGLGFDVVILPDLEGRRIDIRREGLAVQKARDRTVEWIMDLPPKTFYEADEVLSRHVRMAEADACYEALSLLYVGLTRAKRAMYVIIEQGESASRNYPKLLTATLGDEPQDCRIGALVVSGAWSRGDPQWHLAVADATKPAAEAKAELVTVEGAHASKLLGRDVYRPSGDRATRVPVARLFSLEAGGATEFGAKVHALLAEVEWESEVAGAIAAWEARGADKVAATAAAACLRSANLRDVWKRVGEAEVWRERAFEIVLDGVWVTGVFDRVVVERGVGRRVEWVSVFDFKTDRVEDEQSLQDAVRRHAAQLNVYRRVAAVLAGVPVDAVSCELVFTQMLRRVRVEAA
jgi:ATP-dependent exoDNAse (exonuclease V) beta subunit